MTNAKKEIIAYGIIAAIFVLVISIIVLITMQQSKTTENSDNTEKASASEVEKETIPTLFFEGTSPMYKKEISSSELSEGVSLKRMAYGEDTDEIDIVPGVHGSANLKIDIGSKSEDKAYADTDAIVNMDVSIISKSGKDIDLPLIVGVDFDADTYCDAFYSDILTKGKYKINDPTGLEIESNVKDATVEIKGDLTALKNDTKIYYFKNEKNFYEVTKDGKGDKNTPINKDSDIEGMAVYNIKWFYPYKILETPDKKKYENNKDRTDPNDVIVRIMATAKPV